MKKLLSFLAIGALLALVVTVFSVTAFAQDAEDTEAPSYVDNVAVVPGDSEVTLSWDAATDDVGVTGYNIYVGTESVTEPAGEYNMGSVEAGDVLESTVTGLENDVTYYFAVTAVDEAGNESMDYSFEESATPEESGDDGTHPTVDAAEATDCDTITVTFSEEVVLLEEEAQSSFTIENLDSLLYLDVTAAMTLGEDATMVTLTTDMMEESAQYMLTVGSSIEDVYGNALVSGTSDTAIFSGMACAVSGDDDDDDVVVGDDDDDDVTDDTNAPTLNELIVTSLTEVELTFDEAVYLPEDEDLEDDVDPALALFEIFDGDNNVVAVTAVLYLATEDDVDMTTLVLTTEEHLAETEYFIAVTGLMDEAGNATEGDFTSATTYTTPEADDTVVLDEVAPEDVSAFVADALEALVNLNWESSVNSAGDLVDQMLYVSSDGGETYGDAESLGSDATTYSFSSGVEGETYSFRVTTVDESGNESEGVVVTATLPVTGVGLALLGAASLLGGGALARRRRK